LKKSGCRCRYNFTCGECLAKNAFTFSNVYVEKLRKVVSRLGWSGPKYTREETLRDKELAMREFRKYLRG